MTLRWYTVLNLRILGIQAMATSDAPLNVPNVTLAVARGASSEGSTIWRANEPATHDISYPELNFETWPDSQTGWATSTPQPANLSLVSDASVPFNSPFVGRSTIQAGTQGGSAPINIYSDGAVSFRVKKEYFCFWHRWSDNFEDGNKLLFVYTRDDSTDASSATFFLSPRLIGEFGGTEQYMRAAIQNEFTNLMSPNLTQTPIVLGQWHFIECLLGANSAGTADGSVELWVDGEKNIEQMAVQFRNDSHIFTKPLIQPTWAGSDTTAVETFWHDYSSIYVSGGGAV